MKKITIKWKTSKQEDKSRASAMFCFKRCSANKN